MPLAGSLRLKPRAASASDRIHSVSEKLNQENEPQDTSPETVKPEPAEPEREQVGDFITRQILEKDTVFFEG